MGRMLMFCNSSLRFEASWLKYVFFYFSNLRFTSLWQSLNFVGDNRNLIQIKLFTSSGGWMPGWSVIVVRITIVLNNVKEL